MGSNANIGGRIIGATLGSAQGIPVNADGYEAGFRDGRAHVDWEQRHFRERMLDAAIRGCPSSDAKRLVNDAKMLEAYVLGEQKTEE